eukprot:5383965-Pleurochrysis_carterae.AAC.1
MRQTNDSEYVTSFVLDPDRGFRDKVYQIYESGNPIESSALRGSHVSFAMLTYVDDVFEWADPADELYSILQLRKRVAEYAYHVYRDVSFTKLKGS